MNILAKKPLALAEVKTYIKDIEEKKALEEYMKKFTQLSKEKAKELEAELTTLNNVKIREADMVKVVDFLPKSSEEVNKLFTDVSLSEEESNAIIEIVKKY